MYIFSYMCKNAQYVYTYTKYTKGFQKVHKNVSLEQKDWNPCIFFFWSFEFYVNFLWIDINKQLILHSYSISIPIVIHAILLNCVNWFLIT